ncbi:hypothetical protein CPLU01_02326 [Colletotrichum plurivorum]|uniref:Uncharacterized protein n=1 Tax=Colletotrichum plurivorum TaxID=2175906 RepID=A0A8H6KX59_9PEZI|nr:hypothetical protein CPLU01_02326 [Colletotrichum plurivorum]
MNEQACVSWLANRLKSRAVDDVPMASCQRLDRWAQSRVVAIERPSVLAMRFKSGTALSQAKRGNRVHRAGWQDGITKHEVLRRRAGYAQEKKNPSSLAPLALRPHRDGHEHGGGDGCKGVRWIASSESWDRFSLGSKVRPPPRAIGDRTSDGTKLEHWAEAYPGARPGDLQQIVETAFFSGFEKKGVSTLPQSGLQLTFKICEDETGREQRELARRGIHDGQPSGGIELAENSEGACAEQDKGTTSERWEAQRGSRNSTRRREAPTPDLPSVLPNTWYPASIGNSEQQYLPGRQIHHSKAPSYNLSQRKVTQSDCIAVQKYQTSRRLLRQHMHEIAYTSTGRRYCDSCDSCDSSYDCYDCYDCYYSTSLLLPTPRSVLADGRITISVNLSICRYRPLRPSIPLRICRRAHSAGTSTLDVT